MSDDANDRRPAETETEAEEQGSPPTPFDHPLFLPVLFVAGVIWFGYDGWINTDPAMLEHRTFNRVGFAVLVVLAAWFGYKGLNEYKADKEAAARDAAGTGSEARDTTDR